MMHFLRKHQKKMFLVIAVVTIGSFTFFGTPSAGRIQETPNKKMGRTIDGSTIYERDLKVVSQFLALGSSEMLRTDLFETGALVRLSEKYFDQIQNDFETRLQKARTASFYAHPQAPFLSAMQMWNRFFPQLAQHLHEVRSKEASVKTFEAYTQLYLDQQSFPPEMLRTILLYEIQNYSGIAPDQHLSDARHLALFGYQSLEEWFGSSFSDLLGKFILNTAALAEKKGYKVSQREARADLIMNYYQAARLKSMQREVSSRDATDFMRSHLQMMGVDESHAVRLWRKMMLVHRFFHDLEQGVLLDALPYETFSTFSDAKASVVIYRLPEVLRCKDFQSMLKVQYYLDAVSLPSKQALDLPQKFHSPSQVEKKHPQLVTRRYELEVAKASYEEITAQISLKQTWNFQTSLGGWNLLAEAFPVLKKAGEETLEGRLSILDQLDEKLRLKIDRFAICCMIKQHPEWIEKVFASNPAEKVIASIRSKGANAPFDDIEETQPLLLALQEAEEGQTIQFVSPAMTYYQIKVLEKPAAQEIVTLDEAFKRGYLEELLNEKLESLFVDARRKDPSLYKDQDGSWKSFSEVKDQVGAYVYADLLKSIAKEPLALEEYPRRRFEGVMKQAEQSIQSQKEDSPFLAGVGSALVDQWKLIKERKEIKRSDITALPKEEVFSKPIGSWSSVTSLQSGDIAFFHLLDRESTNPAIHDQVHAGQKLIGRDITKQMIETILDEIGPL